MKRKKEFSRTGVPGVKKGRNFVIAFFCLSYSVLLAAGCAAAKGNISGQVKFMGQAVPSGRITALSEVGKKPVFTSYIQDGEYSFQGVPVGLVTITVETFRPAPMGGDLKIPDGLLKSRAAGATGKNATDKPEESSAEYWKYYVPLPPKYEDPKKSGLTYTVLKGDQTHDVELQTDPEPTP